MFRVPGEFKVVKKIQTSINAGETVDLSTMTDYNTLASLLKLYLRELPESLCTLEKYSEFIKLGSSLKNVGDSITSSQKILCELPSNIFYITQKPTTLFLVDSSSCCMKLV